MGIQAFGDLGLRMPRGFWRDPWYLAAGLCGPLFWAALWLTGQDHSSGAEHFLSWPFAYVTVLGPIVEEIAFRGALQGLLRDFSWGRAERLGISGANLLQAAVFAGLHLFSHPPLWAVAVMVPALVFGFFRERMNSLYPVMLLHAWYNAGYFAVSGLP